MHTSFDFDGFNEAPCRMAGGRLAKLSGRVCFSNDPNEVSKKDSELRMNSSSHFTSPLHLITTSPHHHSAALQTTSPHLLSVDMVLNC